MSEIGEYASQLEGLAEALHEWSTKVGEVSDLSHRLGLPWKSIGSQVEDSVGRVVATCIDSASADFIVAATTAIMELDE